MTIKVSQGSTSGGPPSNKENVSVVSASGGGTVTIPDPFASPYDTVTDVTLTGNPTFAFPPAAAGKSFTLLLRQDGTGGRTFTFPGGITWLGGGVQASTAGSAVDIATFLCTDGVNWIGVYSPEQVATTWNNVSSFTNSWTNVGSSNVPARYRLDALGFVHLEGYMAPGTNNTVAFNLPAGFRPGYIITAPADSGTPGAGKIVISTTGDVTLKLATVGDGTIGFSVVFLAEG